MIEEEVLVVAMTGGDQSVDSQPTYSEHRTEANDEESSKQKLEIAEDNNNNEAVTTMTTTTSTTLIENTSVNNTFSSPSSYGPKNRITSVSLANFDVKSKIQWFEALASPPHSNNNANTNALSPNSKKKHRVALKHRHQQGGAGGSGHRFYPSSYSSSSSSSTGRRGIKPATATCCPSPMVPNNGNKAKASLIMGSQSCNNSPSKTSSPTFSALARGKKQCWDAVRRSRQFAAQKMASILSSPTSSLSSPSHQSQQRTTTFASPTMTTATTTTSTLGFTLSPPTQFYQFGNVIEETTSSCTNSNIDITTTAAPSSSATQEGDEMVVVEANTSVSPRQITKDDETRLKKLRLNFFLCTSHSSSY